MFILLIHKAFGFMYTKSFALCYNTSKMCCYKYQIYNTREPTQLNFQVSQLFSHWTSEIVVQLLYVLQNWANRWTNSTTIYGCITQQHKEYPSFSLSEAFSEAKHFTRSKEVRHQELVVLSCRYPILCQRDAKQVIAKAFSL